MANLSPSPQTESLDPRRGLLDLHLHEYDALTTRITYWIAIQYGLLGLVGAYLGFAVQELNHVTVPTLVLTSVLVIEVLIWCVLQTQYEIFNTAQYVERHLKPKITPLVRSDEYDNSFWGWEPYLNSQRAGGYIHFDWKWASLFFVLLLGVELMLWVIISVIKHGPWINSTYFWSCWGTTDLYVLILLAFKVRINLAKGKDITAPDCTEVASSPIALNS